MKMEDSKKQASTEEAEEIPAEITFDEFHRIDLRVAKVLEASRIPNSARLLKLKLDIAGTEKQCIAGIGAKYEPDQLKEKLIVVVMNIKPRSLMGLTSEVMLLAAADGPELSAVTLDRPLNSGSKVT